MRALFIFIISLFAFGCAGEAIDEPAPVPPNVCRADSIVTTPNGRRLLVECTRDVENPPSVCESVGNGEYLCNVYHADQVFCETFPHVCDPPS